LLRVVVKQRIFSHLLDKRFSIWLNICPVRLLNGLRFLVALPSQSQSIWKRVCTTREIGAAQSLGRIRDQLNELIAYAPADPGQLQLFSHEPLVMAQLW
jgi:hypothetical protein